MLKNQISNGVDLNFDENENKREEEEKNLISTKLLEDDLELEDNLENLPV